MEKLDSLNLNEYMEKDIVFVDFWAEWCGPCQALAPIYESVSKKYEQKAVFLKCNVDQERNIALKNGILSIPCIIVFKKGIAVDKCVGLVNQDLLENFILKNLA